MKAIVPGAEQAAGVAESAAIEPSRDEAPQMANEVSEAHGERPVDYRRVEHGHGPCSCCGPYGE